MEPTIAQNFYFFSKILIDPNHSDFDGKITKESDRFAIAIAVGVLTAGLLTLIAYIFIKCNQGAKFDTSKDAQAVAVAVAVAVDDNANHDDASAIDDPAALETKPDLVIDLTVEITTSPVRKTAAAMISTEDVFRGWYNQLSRVDKELVKGCTQGPQTITKDQIHRLMNQIKPSSYNSIDLNWETLFNFARKQFKK